MGYAVVGVLIGGCAWARPLLRFACGGLSALPEEAQVYDVCFHSVMMLHEGNGQCGHGLPVSEGACRVVTLHHI